MSHPLFAPDASSKPFSLKQKLLLCLIPSTVSVCAKSLLATCRLDVQGSDYYEAAVRAHGRTIIAVWHETIALAARYHHNSGHYTLTSHSFDGELAARVANCFGMYAARGSSSRGGSEALIDLERVIADGSTVGLTVDGPRGPRRVAKPGAAILAARTGLPVVPQAFHARRAWHMRSWDKLSMPKPFATIKAVFGPPHRATPELFTRSH